MNTTLETSCPMPAVGTPLRFMVVALWLPGTSLVAASLHTEFQGARMFERSLAHALERECVAFEPPVLLVPALSRVVCSFIVGDTKAALTVLRQEVQRMELQHWCVIGVRDKAEGFYRPPAPEKPLFDLDRRMRTAYPLTTTGDFSGEHPEMDHFLTIMRKKLADDLAHVRALQSPPPENPS